MGQALVCACEVLEWMQPHRDGCPWAHSLRVKVTFSFGGMWLGLRFCSWTRPKVVCKFPTMWMLPMPPWPFLKDACLRLLKQCWLRMGSTKHNRENPVSGKILPVPSPWQEQELHQVANRPCWRSVITRLFPTQKNTKNYIFCFHETLGDFWGDYEQKSKEALL